jgi:hypothetical protein
MTSVLEPYTLGAGAATVPRVLSVSDSQRLKRREGRCFGRVPTARLASAETFQPDNDSAGERRTRGGGLHWAEQSESRSCPLSSA